MKSLGLKSNNLFFFFNTNSYIIFVLHDYFSINFPVLTAAIFIYLYYGLLLRRLSTALSKPDKVLVVERVIEFLGLQTVRASLVGTVEKRGISGGQRKRVNVGLEMVMEPSLLILDEPTSGLDSASSQQLLRALRREALEGVNICMVVHQPR